MTTDDIYEGDALGWRRARHVNNYRERIYWNALERNTLDRYRLIGQYVVVLSHCQRCISYYFLIMRRNKTFRSRSSVHRVIIENHRVALTFTIVIAVLLDTARSVHHLLERQCHFGHNQIVQRSATPCCCFSWKVEMNRNCSEIYGERMQIRSRWALQRMACLIASPTQYNALSS